MFRKIFVVSVVALAVLAQRSSAAIVDLTWTGVTQFGGNDGIGLFGPPSPIPGLIPYVAKYRFDTSISFVENGTNGSEEASGGVFFDPDRPSPWISASITINGATVSVNGEYAASYFRQTGQGASQISSLAQRLLANPQPYGGELFQRVFRAGNFYATPNLDQPGEFTFDFEDNPSGSFSYANLAPDGSIIANTQVALLPATLSIKLVPEPAASVLAVVCAAVAMQRRRRTAS